MTEEGWRDMQGGTAQTHCDCALSPAAEVGSNRGSATQVRSGRLILHDVEFGQGESTGQISARNAADEGGMQ